MRPFLNRTIWTLTWMITVYGENRISRVKFHSQSEYSKTNYLFHFFRWLTNDHMIVPKRVHVTYWLINRSWNYESWCSSFWKRTHSVALSTSDLWNVLSASFHLPSIILQDGWVNEKTRPLVMYLCWVSLRKCLTTRKVNSLIDHQIGLISIHKKRLCVYFLAQKAVINSVTCIPSVSGLSAILSSHTIQLDWSCTACVLIDMTTNSQPVIQLSRYLSQCDNSPNCSC